MATIHGPVKKLEARWLRDLFVLLFLLVVAACCSLMASEVVTPEVPDGAVRR